MKIFQVTRPGNFLADEKGEVDADGGSLLTLLESSYVDANASYDLFNESRIALREHMRLAPEQMLAVQKPQAFIRRRPFISAKSFLYAMDTFRSALGAMEKRPNPPAGLSAAISAFDSAFPGMRDVRNSAHHFEDRILGLKSGGKPIDIQPVTTGGIVTSGGAIVLDSLHNDRYGNLLADGTFGEVEVSEASMLALQDLYQNLLNSCTFLDAAMSSRYVSNIIC